MTEKIEALVARVKACRICRDDPRGNVLPHEPRPVLVPSEKARIVICGQAPGARVHQSGRPFTDPSGDRLRHWLGVDEEAFYNPEKFAIIPMGFCFPGYDAKGGDLPPRRECRATWHDDVFASMPQLELILTIGQYAQSYHLGSLKRPTLTETVYNWRAIYDGSKINGGPAILPMPHPSWRNNHWLKKNPWFERDFIPFLRGCVASFT